MPSAPIPNWPQMKVTEHYVQHKDMRDRCSKYVTNPFMSPEACAEWNIASHTCDIYYSADFPPSDWIKEHERAHCKGYSH